LTTKVSHGSVAMQLRCGEMFNNHTTATCPQSLPVKKFWKSVNIWRRYGWSQSGTFFETQFSRTIEIRCCHRHISLSVHTCIEDSPWWKERRGGLTLRGLALATKTAHTTTDGQPCAHTYSDI